MNAGERTADSLELKLVVGLQLSAVIEWHRFCLLALY